MITINKPDEETIRLEAEMYLDNIVTISDAQALGYCVAGTRKLWRSMQDDAGQVNGVSFESFIKNGVTVRWLLDLNQPYTDTLAYYVVRKLNHG